MSSNKIVVVREYRVCKVLYYYIYMFDITYRYIEPPPTRIGEIIIAIKSLKKNKAAGLDQVPRHQHFSHYLYKYDLKKRS